MFEVPGQVGGSGAASTREATGRETRLLVWLPLVISLVLLVLAPLVPDSVPAAPIPANGVISTGGTYTGTRVATGPEEVAVTITTVAPVVLDRCAIRGKDDLISVTAPGANVTVRDCTGVAENPNATGQLKGRFIKATPDHPGYPRTSRVVNEKNHIEGTRGIWIPNGTPSAQGEIRIRGN